MKEEWPNHNSLSKTFSSMLSSLQLMGLRKARDRAGPTLIFVNMPTLNVKGRNDNPKGRFVPRELFRAKFAGCIFAEFKE